MYKTKKAPLKKRRKNMSTKKELEKKIEKLEKEKEQLVKMLQTELSYVTVYRQVLSANDLLKEADAFKQHIERLN